MEQDWLYSDDRMALREQCLSILLRRFGSTLNEDGTPVHSTESVYACAHDWVSQGNMNVDGLLNFYHEYYETKDEELPGELTTEQHSEDT